jgi:hypothetical protein
MTPAHTNVVRGYLTADFSARSEWLTRNPTSNTTGCAWIRSRHAGGLILTGDSVFLENCLPLSDSGGSAEDEDLGAPVLSSSCLDFGIFRPKLASGIFNPHRNSLPRDTAHGKCLRAPFHEPHVIIWEPDSEVLVTPHRLQAKRSTPGDTRDALPCLHDRFPGEIHRRTFIQVVDHHDGSIGRSGAELQNRCGEGIHPVNPLGGSTDPAEPRTPESPADCELAGRGCCGSPRHPSEAVGRPSWWALHVQQQFEHRLTKYRSVQETQIRSEVWFGSEPASATENYRHESRSRRAGFGNPRWFLRKRCLDGLHHASRPARLCRCQRI